MVISVARFLDVAGGVQPRQFSVGAHDQIASLDELDPIYARLLTEPIVCVLGLVGGDGRVNQTPMWFDHADDTILLNVAAHRKKVDWIRAKGQVSALLVNPQNPYHWVSIKATVSREISEDDPSEGHLVTEQLDRVWTKYTGQAPPYGLRDPQIDERRILFVCDVDRVATFGKP